MIILLIYKIFDYIHWYIKLFKTLSKEMLKMLVKLINGNILREINIKNLTFIFKT